MMIKDIHTQKHILGYGLERQHTMARVTQNGDLKEREKEKVHERNIHLGEFVSYAYSNPSLAPNCHSYGSEYNDVITWG